MPLRIVYVSTTLAVKLFKNFRLSAFDEFNPICTRGGGGGKLAHRQVFPL